jgi:hypothetical protein
LGREIPKDVLEKYSDYVRRNPEMLHSAISSYTLACVESSRDPRWPGNTKIAQDKQSADDIIKAREVEWQKAHRGTPNRS